MCGTTAFFYNDDLLRYQFGPEHPYQPIRFQMIRDTLRELNVFDGRLEYVESPSATEEDLREVHDRSLIEHVKEMSATGTGYLDMGDTPVCQGLFEGALAAVGAMAARRRMHVLVGSPVFRRHTLHNGLVVFDRQGRVSYCYAKCHLTEMDRKHFVPGDAVAYAAESAGLFIDLPPVGEVLA